MVRLIDDILKVFARNNLFDEGVELIGSWCFHLYQKHLGVQSFPLRTQDIDFLIPNPFKGKEHQDFIKELEGLGFSCEHKRDGSIFLWSTDLKIEFLTPEKGRGADQAIHIKQLGIRAIPLRFVGFLLDDPLTVVDNGIKISVPHPANFCLHKLIIAGRRRPVDKKLKDLEQAIHTFTIVDKKEIQKLFISLPRKWKAAILNILDKNKESLPLLTEKINDMRLTLQEVVK